MYPNVYGNKGIYVIFNVFILFYLLFWWSYGANPMIPWLVSYVQTFLFKVVTLVLLIVYEIRQINPLNQRSVNNLYAKLALIEIRKWSHKNLFCISLILTKLFSLSNLESVTHSISILRKWINIQLQLNSNICKNWIQA